MGNLAYNPEEGTYLLHNGDHGPAGTIMEGCCCDENWEYEPCDTGWYCGEFITYSTFDGTCVGLLYTDPFIHTMDELVALGFVTWEACIAGAPPCGYDTKFHFISGPHATLQDANDSCGPLDDWYYCVDDIHYNTWDGSCGGAPSWTNRQVMTGLDLAGVTFGACIPGDGFCTYDHKYILISGPYETYGEASAACP